MSNPDHHICPSCEQGVEEHHICYMCRKMKEDLVKINVEFPNPLEEKYPEILLESYIYQLFYCHRCVFKIFNIVYPKMHDDLISRSNEEDEDIKEAYKPGQLECECGTRMNDRIGFSCEDKEQLK